MEEWNCKSEKVGHKMVEAKRIKRAKNKGDKEIDARNGTERLRMYGESLFH
jgi:hypothetical protein